MATFQTTRKLVFLVGKAELGALRWLGRLRVDVIARRAGAVVLILFHHNYGCSLGS